MNALQRLVLLLGVVAVVGMGIYPPWIYTTEAAARTGGESIRGLESAGYFFITQPPAPKPGRLLLEQKGVRLDTARLAVQESIAIVAVIMGVFLFASPRSRGPTNTGTA